jgi:hypothetical protein
MIWNNLPDHAQAIRATVAMLRDETFPERSKLGLRNWLKCLLNEYEFIDNRFDGGYAIKVVPREILKH